MNDAPPQLTLADALPSQVSGIHWPSVVGARDAAVLSLLFQMKRAQWLSNELLRKKQHCQLDALLTRAGLQTQAAGKGATTYYPRARATSQAVIMFKFCHTWPLQN